MRREHMALWPRAPCDTRVVVDLFIAIRPLARGLAAAEPKPLRTKRTRLKARPVSEPLAFRGPGGEEFPSLVHLPLKIA